jgi:hypothetical protein
MTVAVDGDVWNLPGRENVEWNSGWNPMAGCWRR